jgi:endonuclease/exonuclease/phosphatase family metal-dependent hydrolase
MTPHQVVAESARNLEPADDYRAVGHVRFAWHGREVDAYSTHLHHTAAGGSIRATQIRHLLAYVDSTKGDGPVVVAGDFNAELGTPEMDLVTARYVDAFRSVHPNASRAEAVTFNARFEVDPGAIDHVFVEREGTKRLSRPHRGDLTAAWARDSVLGVGSLRSASRKLRAAVVAPFQRSPIGARHVLTRSCRPALLWRAFARYVHPDQ